MSLKKTAMRMAIAFAAAKGYQTFQSRGGMQGVRDMLAQQSSGRSGMGATGGRASGGLGGLMASLGGGGSSASGGGLGGLLGALGGGAGGMGASGIGASSLGRSGMGGATGRASMGGSPMGGMGGLLGGLAAMAAGGAAAMPRDEDARLRMAEAGPQDEATAAAMVRAIGQAVRADGEIDADERAVLDEVIGDAETEEDREALDRALSEPVNPEALARDVPRGHESEVYAAALTAIDPDHPGEKDFLRRFATALALEPAEIDRLHEAAGKPR